MNQPAVFLNVLIVEDEPHARDLLIDYVAQIPSLRLSGVAKSGKEAIEHLQARQIDLLLLDINLPGISGIDLIREVSPLPSVIFCTANEKFAIQAFEIGAIDYLLKPISFERFESALKKLEVSRSSPDNLLSGGTFLKCGRTNIYLQHEKIIYITGHGKYSVLHTHDKEFKTLHHLKDLEGRLPAETFKRIHKQFIVNAKYIDYVEYHVSEGNYLAHLSDEEKTTLPVGKSYADKFKL